MPFELVKLFPGGYMKFFSVIVFIFSVQQLQAAPSNTWPQDRVKAAKAWQAGYFGSGVKIAVIDTGVDLKNPHLQGCLYNNPNEVPNGIDDDNNGFIDDINGWNFVSQSPDVQDDGGHGTGISSIICAPHSSAIKGIAPGVKIIPVKFMQEGRGSLSNAIKSIHYAVDQGAQIVVLGWGAIGYSQQLEDAIQDLLNKNILFVTAAGNSGRDLSFSPESPAVFNLPNLITAGSLGYLDFLNSFSNYGNPVHLAAPGGSIHQYGLNSQTIYLSSTSVAAAFVAGGAALLKEKYPILSASEIKDKIIESVDPIKNLPVYSGGVLDISKMLDLP